MSGIATLQVFEELTCEEPDCPDVRTHLHFCLHARTNMHPCLAKSEQATD